MTDDDKAGFKQVMVGLGELYSKEISVALLRLYFEALREFSMEDVRRAANLHVQDPESGKFFPKPADIIKFVKGTAGEQALDAWRDVHAAIVNFGPYDSIRFGDPISQGVIHEMGGWVKMCDTPTKDMPFVQKEFERRYASYYSKHYLPSVIPNRLYGDFELENSKMGYEVKPIIREVGDCSQTLALAEQSKQAKAISGIAKAIAKAPE